MEESFISFYFNRDIKRDIKNIYSEIPVMHTTTLSNDSQRYDPWCVISNEFEIKSPWNIELESMNGEAG